MAGTRPRRRSVDDIKSNLLRPATTSHFDVFIQEPAGGVGAASGAYNWSKFKVDNGISGYDKEFLHLCCSETVLPGSSLATTEINNDHTGVTERHAYRRLFDDRIDLTFYVMQDQSVPTPDSIMGRESQVDKFFPKPPSPNAYLPIRFFEGWIKFISTETIAGENSVRSRNYAYRMRYPEEYYGGLTITKYERDYGNNNLSYSFVGCYPISVSSMPVSYDASDLLKVTVSMSYIRYILNQVPGAKSPMLANPFTPESQALFNTQNFGFPTDFDAGIDYGESFPNFQAPNGIFNQSLNGGELPFVTEGFL